MRAEEILERLRQKGYTADSPIPAPEPGRSFVVGPCHTIMTLRSNWMPTKKAPVGEQKNEPGT